MFDRGCFGDLGIGCCGGTHDDLGLMSDHVQLRSAFRGPQQTYPPPLLVFSADTGQLSCLADTPGLIGSSIGGDASPAQSRQCGAARAWQRPDGGHYAHR